jgi:hypothetical protein
LADADYPEHTADESHNEGEDREPIGKGEAHATSLCAGLWHSKLSTTMDLYVHAYDEDLREAVGALDRALGS